jgi:hypothetical protein
MRGGDRDRCDPDRLVAVGPETAQEGTPQDEEGRAPGTSPDEEDAARGLPAKPSAVADLKPAQLRYLALE